MRSVLGEDLFGRAAKKHGHVSEYPVIEVVLGTSRIHGAHLSAERINGTWRLWVQDAYVVGSGHLGSWTIGV